MRILHVTPAYEPFLDKGGPAVKVGAIAENLARRGVRVTVLTTTYDASRALGSMEIRGVEVIYLPFVARYRALTLNPGILRFCRRHIQEFDLVHMYGLYDLLSPPVASFCLSRKIPYVLEPLGMIRQIDRSFFLKRAWHVLFGATLLRGAARLIATSQQERREMLEDGFPPGRIALRYNGLDPAEFAVLPARGSFRARHGIAPGEPVVLFLGRLIPRKGVNLLIEAFARACPMAGRLVIAGPEGERGYLAAMKETAKSCGLAERAVFTGPLFGEQKKEALVDADVFALPSEYENFANSVAEAIACGTPVIVTDRCGISEFVEGHAGLVIPRSVAALTDALRRLFSDPSFYRQCKAQCPGVVARLDWNTILGPMMQLYGELARKTDGRY